MTKELRGYLVDRTTGVGVAGEPVTYKTLAGVEISTSHGTVWQDKDAVTQADGSFHFSCDLSPGPIQVFLDIAADEKKARFFDEKAQAGIQWGSDISRLGHGFGNGVVRGHLNELALSVSGGNIRVATGTAIIDGSVWNLEHGASDAGYYLVAATANAGGSGIDPRLDLVTARQYKESATGQDSGRQSVVVTLGTVTNTLPAVPTDASWTDLPLGVITTPAGGSSSVSTSYPQYPAHVNPSVADKVPVITRLKGTGSLGLTTSYVTHQTITVSGLNPSLTYDGEFIMQYVAMGSGFSVSPDMPIYQDVTYVNVYGGALTDVLVAEVRSTDGIQQLGYHLPLVGITGVTGFSYDIRLKTVANGIASLTAWDHFIKLRPR